MAQFARGRAPGRPPGSSPQPRNPLDALAALGRPEPLATLDGRRQQALKLSKRGADKTFFMRSAKARYKAEDMQREHEAKMRALNDDAEVLAGLAGIAINGSSGSKGSNSMVWPAMNILRAAFTPVSSTACPPFVFYVCQGVGTEYLLGRSGNRQLML